MLTAQIKEIRWEINHTLGICAEFSVGSLWCVLVARRGPKHASPPGWSPPNPRAGFFEGRVTPTCRPAYLTPVTAQTFPPPSTPRSWISPQAFPPSHACPPKAQQLFEHLLRCYRAAQSSSILLFSLETARNDWGPIVLLIRLNFNES